MLLSAQNNITPTSELALKSDYHLFKKGIRPEWEDNQNKHGGKFSPNTRYISRLIVGIPGKWSYQFKGEYLFSLYQQKR